MKTYEVSKNGEVLRNISILELLPYLQEDVTIKNSDGEVIKEEKHEYIQNILL